jgi:hypothetical protein
VEGTLKFGSVLPDFGVLRLQTHHDFDEGRDLWFNGVSISNHPVRVQHEDHKQTAVISIG